ncbi:MAG: hypothetical protein R3E79_50010 [Caldilineaceae bacterium]
MTTLEQRHDILGTEKAADGVDIQHLAEGGHVKVFNIDIGAFQNAGGLDQAVQFAVALVDTPAHGADS